MTIGHSPYRSSPNETQVLFSEEAWVCDEKRNRYHGILCPTSQEARDYLYEFAKIILEELRPDSYWLDDDCRLGFKCARICFCPRCLALFNRKNPSALSREDLAQKLFRTINQAESIRKKWCEFNAEFLADYAAYLRKAADEVMPNCRL